MTTEIIPYIGFDKIKLGLTLGQTEKLLGKPDDQAKNEYSDNSSEVVLKYQNLGVDLNFSSDDNYRLGSITFYSKKFTLNKKNLIGLNKSELILRFKTLFPDFKLDDDFKELNVKDYTIDSTGLSIWLDNGIVESVTLFPKYKDDNETVIWPN